MDKTDSIQILQDCINQLENITKEEFIESLEKKGLLNREYNANYVDEDFEIFNAKKVREYLKIKGVIKNERKKVYTLYT